MAEVLLKNIKKVYTDNDSKKKGKKKVAKQPKEGEEEKKVNLQITDEGVVAVQMIFSFVGSWNNYFMPSLLLNDLQKKTVPVMITTLRSADFTKFDMGKVYMLMVMAILPVMVIYVILSKSIIKGVTSGSVKG